MQKKDRYQNQGNKFFNLGGGKWEDGHNEAGKADRDQTKRKETEGAKQSNKEQRLEHTCIQRQTGTKVGRGVA